MDSKLFVTKSNSNDFVEHWIRVDVHGSDELLENNISILICDFKEQKAWSTEITDSVAAEVCKLYGLEPSNYWKLIIDALHSSAAGEYTLTVKDERFRIEKLGSSSNLKFVYGDLPLVIAAFAQSASLIMQTQMNTINEIQMKNKELNKKVVNLSKEKSTLHEKLDTFTNDAVVKEETMLSNFLVLLNTKKDEIKRLRENGSGPNNGLPLENQASPNSEYDADTDEGDNEGVAASTSTNSSSIESLSKRKKPKNTANNADDIMDL